MSLSSSRAAHKAALPSILCLFATASPTLAAWLSRSLSTERCACPQQCVTLMCFSGEMCILQVNTWRLKNRPQIRAASLCCSQGLLANWNLSRGLSLHVFHTLYWHAGPQDSQMTDEEKKCLEKLRISCKQTNKKCSKITRCLKNLGQRGPRIVLCLFASGNLVCVNITPSVVTFRQWDSVEFRGGTVFLLYNAVCGKIMEGFISTIVIGCSLINCVIYCILFQPLQ